MQNILIFIPNINELISRKSQSTNAPPSSMRALMKKVILKKKEDRRITGGHPWVFSNEILEIQGSPAIGDLIEVFSAGGSSLGIGYYNPHSLIAVRLLAKKPIEIDAEFFRERIQQGMELRDRLYPEPVYRMIHGESDFLPGLVIDRFNSTFSIQTYSYGMDKHIPVICDILEELFHPSAIVERNESPLRLLEQLPQKKGILRGQPLLETITEHGVSFSIDALDGQKTGFFLDQRENRIAARRFCSGARVLDCFCNEGGFALHAAAAGADTVSGVDISAHAINQAQINAQRNGLARVTFEKNDVFDYLKRTPPSSYDVVILDPPSFTKNRKTLPVAKKGYRSLHRNAMQTLKRGGILITASCSHHLEAEVFLELIDDSARELSREVQVLDWRGAAPDHPVLPSVPETRYLVCGFLRVL
jgi:23S rRNA (cytosine1962-C5)-methyltransferase